LGNIKILGGNGDVAGVGNLLEYAIEFQFDGHRQTSCD
jgi:hypothetical protein